MKGIITGFRDFILRGNVLDLAVAVVVGGAFNAIVQSLVKDMITPFIAAIGGNREFATYYFSINHSKFMYGDFINAVISFVIIAAVVYFFIVTPMNRLLARVKKGEKVDPTEKQCPFCMSQVPIKATKCKFCTSKLEETEAEKK